MFEENRVENDENRQQLITEVTEYRSICDAVLTKKKKIYSFQKSYYNNLFYLIFIYCS